MINYKDPPVELLPNPTGVDFAIQAIQEKLATLPWLQKVFGRCTPQSGTRPEANVLPNARLRNDFTYPEVYYKREPYNCMPNDNLRSYCFFHAKDPLQFPATDANERADMYSPSLMASTGLSIIFWANLELVDPTKQYNFVEDLRRDVFVLLRNKVRSFTAAESSIGFERVFSPFTITETYRKYLKPPYTAFRIDGTLSFDYLIC